LPLNVRVKLVDCECPTPVCAAQELCCKRCKWCGVQVGGKLGGKLFIDLSQDGPSFEVAPPPCVRVCVCVCVCVRVCVVCACVCERERERGGKLGGKLFIDISQDGLSFEVAPLSCITQLKAQGPSRNCNESKEEGCPPVSFAGNFTYSAVSTRTQCEAVPRRARI